MLNENNFTPCPQTEKCDHSNSSLMDEVRILLSSNWKQEVKDSFLICENECREH